MTESHKLSYGSSRIRSRNRKCQKTSSRKTNQRKIHKKSHTQKKTDTPQRVWLHRLKFTSKHTWIQWQNENNNKHKQNNKHTSILLAHTHTLSSIHPEMFSYIYLYSSYPPTTSSYFLIRKKTTTNGHNKLLDLQINNNNSKSSHSNCHSNRRWLRQFVIRSLSRSFCFSCFYVLALISILIYATLSKFVDCVRLCVCVCLSVILTSLSIW